MKTPKNGQSFNFANMSEYPLLVREVGRNGIQQASRVGATRELENVLVVYGDTSVTPPRRSRTASLIGFLEGVQLIAGESHNDLMRELFPGMAKFTDFSATYGERVGDADQINAVFNLLDEDPDTRRAVLNIWDHRIDAAGQGLDRPCTLSINFRVRPYRAAESETADFDKQLNMSVVQRSNDVIRGHYGDTIQFALLQRTFANALGIASGTYAHTAHSLHLYADDLQIGKDTWEQYRSAQDAGEELATDIIGALSMPGWNINDIRDEACEVLNSGEPKTGMGRWILSEMENRREYLRKNG